MKKLANQRRTQLTLLTYAQSEQRRAHQLAITIPRHHLYQLLFDHHLHSAFLSFSVVHSSSISHHVGSISHSLVGEVEPRLGIATAPYGSSSTCCSSSCGFCLIHGFDLFPALSPYIRHSCVSSHSTRQPSTRSAYQERKFHLPHMLMNTEATSSFLLLAFFFFSFCLLTIRNLFVRCHSAGQCSESDWDVVLLLAEVVPRLVDTRVKRLVPVTVSLFLDSKVVKHLSLVVTPNVDSPTSTVKHLSPSTWTKSNTGSTAAS